MSLDPSTAPRSRPMLLGYIRSAVLGSAKELRGATRELDDFVTRENFTLGPVFVDTGDTSGAFHALIDELSRNEVVRGVLIPDRRHLTSQEQLIMSQHEYGAHTPVLTVRFTPLAGGPGTASPFCPGSAFPSGSGPTPGSENTGRAR